MASEDLFTDREIDIMSVLWELGSGTVTEVKERLEDPLAYTTVLTILRTLEDKGKVRHEVEGRAFRYAPVVSLQRAQAAHLRYLIRKLFRGSAVELVDTMQELGLVPETVGAGSH